MDNAVQSDSKAPVSENCGHILCSLSSSDGEETKTNLIQAEQTCDKILRVNESSHNNPNNTDVEEENETSLINLNAPVVQLKREFLCEQEDTNGGEHPSKYIKLNCDNEEVLKTSSYNDNNDLIDRTNIINGKSDELELMERNKLSKLKNRTASVSEIEKQIDTCSPNENCVNNAANSENINENNCDETVTTDTGQTTNMDENELSLTSSSSSSDTLSSFVLEEPSGNRRENNLEISNDENNESESQSSSTEQSSTSFSEEDYDDLDMVSLDIGSHVPLTEDSGSGSDDQKAGSSAEKVPEVLKKTLPVETFSFPKEIFNRQFKGDDVKRKRSTRFEYKMYGSRRMVQRLKLYESLQKHSGCVNCVSFNDTGDILVSGSDDRHVCLWDWSRNRSLLFFDSGHVSNVFQAKFLPNSGDTQLITCGLDHQIRMASLDSCGVKCTRLIVKYAKTVHKIALQPQMPHTFLSAGEDGVVNSIDIRDSKSYCTKLLKMVGNRSNIPVCLYSIHCNPIKNYEFIVCGNDKGVRLFDQRKISRDNSSPVKTFCPAQLSSSDSMFPRRIMGRVTCSVFNYNGTEVLASYNDNDIYLFDSMTGKEVHHYDGHRNFQTVKGVNFYGPRSEYVVSGSDCGYIYIWDKNYEAIVQWLKGDNCIVNCLEPHPSLPVLATSGLESDVKVWMPIPFEDETRKTTEDEVRNLNEDEICNITGSKEFQKVTKKNNNRKFDNFSRYPGGSLIVRSIFDADYMGHEYTRSGLPIILRYRRALRAVGHRRYQRSTAWSSSEEQNDRDDERSCDSVD